MDTITSVPLLYQCVNCNYTGSRSRFWKDVVEEGDVGVVDTCPECQSELPPEPVVTQEKVNRNAKGVRRAGVAYAR